jgi:chaperonin GroES
MAAFSTRPLRVLNLWQAQEDRIGEGGATTMLKPIGDRIVVRPKSAEEMTKSGIILPDTAKERPQEGEVMAVGTGRIMDDGTVVALSVKVGDTVLFSKYGGTEVKIGGEEYIILREDDVLAVLEK